MRTTSEDSALLLGMLHKRESAEEARVMIREHTIVRYLLGLLGGLGLIIYMLYNLKRGYVLRRGGGYIDSKQAPFLFWTDILLGLLLGGLVVAFWKGLAF